MKREVHNFEDEKKMIEGVIEATAKLLDDCAISEGRREDAGYDAIFKHKGTLQAIDEMLNIPFDVLIVIQKNEK